MPWTISIFYLCHSILRAISKTVSGASIVVSEPLALFIYLSLVISTAAVASRTHHKRARITLIRFCVLLFCRCSCKQLMTLLLRAPPTPSVNEKKEFRSPFVVCLLSVRRLRLLELCSTSSEKSHKRLKTFYCFNRISFFVLFIKFASFMNNKRATELFYFRFFFVVWLRFWCWRGFCENSSCLCFVSLFFVVFPRFECQNFFPLRFLQLFMCLALFRHFIWTALGLSLKRNHRILTNRPEQNVCQTIGNGKTKIGKKVFCSNFFFGDEIYSAIEKAFN